MTRKLSYGHRQATLHCAYKNVIWKRVHFRTFTPLHVPHAVDVWRPHECFRASFHKILSQWTHTVSFLSQSRWSHIRTISRVLSIACCTVRDNLRDCQERLNSPGLDVIHIPWLCSLCTRITRRFLRLFKSCKIQAAVLILRVDS